MADYQSWNQQVVGSAPVKPMNEETDFRNQRSAGTFYDEENPDRGTKNPCSRFIAGLFAFILFAAGVGLAVYSFLIKRNDAPLPFCIECSKYTTIGIAVGAGVAVFGLLGLIATKSRNRCLGYPYALIVFLLFLGLLAIGALVGYYALGSKKFSLLEVWEDAVTKEPALVCKLQARLQCSGYQLGCCAATWPNTTTSAPINGTTPPPPALAHLMNALAVNAGSPCWNTTTLPPWYSQVCANCTTATDNSYAETCDAKIETDIHGRAIPMMAIAFGGALASLIDFIAIIRMLAR